MRGLKQNKEKRRTKKPSKKKITSCENSQGVLCYQLDYEGERERDRARKEKRGIRNKDINEFYSR